MKILLFSAIGAYWVGRAYWKRRDRLRRQHEDRVYWEKVRRECPSCGVRRAAETPAPFSSAG